MNRSEVSSIQHFFHTQDQQRRLMNVRAIWGAIALISTLTGCAAPSNIQPPVRVTPSVTPSPPATASSPTPGATPSTPGISGVQQWTTILKGKSAHGLMFTTDGRLFHQGKVLLAEIPVTYSSNGSVTYAQRLIVSAPSPSSTFNVVKACENATSGSGFCWAVFLVDRQSQTAQKIGATKYGGENWVQWSADERYAVFVVSVEGSSWFVVLDLQTGESKDFEQSFDRRTAMVALNSFTWMDDRTFQVNILCRNGGNCKELQFRGSISTLFH